MTWLNVLDVEGSGTIKRTRCGGKGCIYHLPLTGLGGSDFSKCRGSEKYAAPIAKEKEMSNKQGFHAESSLDFE